MKNKSTESTKNPRQVETTYIHNDFNPENVKSDTKFDYPSKRWLAIYFIVNFLYKYSTIFSISVHNFLIYM